MNKTKANTESGTDTKNRILVTTQGLSDLLSCGRHTAENIGIKSGSVVRIGRRKLYSVKKVEEYLYTIAEG